MGMLFGPIDLPVFNKSIISDISDGINNEWSLKYLNETQYLITILRASIEQY